MTTSKSRTAVENILIGLISLVIITPAVWSFSYHYCGALLPEPLNKVLSFTEDRELYGVSAATAPVSDLTFKGWLGRSPQIAFEFWTKENFGFRRIILQTYNYLLYRLLKTSRTYRDLVVGKNDDLFALPYIYDVCLGPERPRLSENQIKETVDRIKKAANLFSERGIPFALVITPNKAYSLPELLPWRVCRELDREGTDYARFVRQAKESGLGFVDGQVLTDSYQKRTGRSAYPRGGLHWHDLAALETYNALTVELQSRAVQRPLFLRQGAPIEQLEEGPIGAENDLLQTMNLLLPDENYTVPHLKFQPLSPTTEKSPHLAIVGGSFTHQLISLMVQNNHIRISRFDYFNLGRSEFSEQGMLSSSGAFEEVSLEEEFFSRDGVILEVNENMISGEHLRKFLNFVLRDR